MERISTQKRLEALMQRQRVLKKEAMSPNFEGIYFSCGCGQRHPAQATPHVACGKLNEFFYQCSNGFVTLVKYKGIFRVKPEERWTCPKEIFWGLFSGVKELDAESATNELKALSDLVSEITGVDNETASAYVSDFRDVYLEAIQEGEEKRDFVVAWGAILHVNKIAGLDEPQSQFLASRAPQEFRCDRAEKLSLQIAKFAITKLGENEKALVLKAVEKIENH